MVLRRESSAGHGTRRGTGRTRGASRSSILGRSAPALPVPPPQGRPGSHQGHGLGGGRGKMAPALTSGLLAQGLALGRTEEVCIGTHRSSVLGPIPPHPCTHKLVFALIPEPWVVKSGPALSRCDNPPRRGSSPAPDAPRVLPGTSRLVFSDGASLITRCRKIF